MISIAILYICTGKYNQFFKGFYESSEKFFLSGKTKKHYFVFTDDLNLTNAKNVTLIQKNCQGFPLDSLFRFEMFLSIEEQLRKYDYTFFFNANMLFVDKVNIDFLPDNPGIAAVIHPGFYKRPSFLKPYERNKQSTAYIPPHLSKYIYYMGSLNGGKTEEYLKLVRECANNTRIDYDNGYIAMVHDESHLNKYMSCHTCMGLHPQYAYPEGWNLPFSPKIILRDKVRLDPYFNKGRNRTFIGRVKKGFRILKRAIIWYI